MIGFPLFNPYMVCESCFLYKKATCLGKHALRKSYKHSVLLEVINPQITEKLCSCRVSRISSAGGGAYSFPVDRHDKHSRKCGLLLLRQSIIRARKRSLQDSLQPKQKSTKLVKKERSPRDSLQPKQKSAELMEKERSLRGSLQSKQKSPNLAKKEKRETNFKWMDQTTRNLSFPGSSSSLCDSEEDLKTAVKKHEITDMLKDVRDSETAQDEFLQALQISEEQTRKSLQSIGGRRRFLETLKKYPFGNVHMSLMVGPIIIENGAQLE